MDFPRKCIIECRGTPGDVALHRVVEAPQRHKDEDSSREIKIVSRGNFYNCENAATCGLIVAKEKVGRQETFDASKIWYEFVTLQRTKDKIETFINKILIYV